MEKIHNDCVSKRCNTIKVWSVILNEEYTLEKHGYARFKTFEVENSTDNSVVFLHKSDDETKESFPFDYELRVFYTLENKTLKIDYSVKNLNDRTMYFSIGSHEGYYTPEGIEDYDVIFPQNETLNSYVLYGNLLSNQQLPIIKDQNYIPLYDKYFTVDALVFKDLKSKSATLRNRKTGKAVKVDFPDNIYEETKIQYMQKVLSIISEANKSMSVPELTEKILTLQKELLGYSTDYYAIKSHFNSLVMSVEGEIEDKINASTDKFKTALLYAMSGNFIDFGAKLIIFIKGGIEITEDYYDYSEIKKSLK